MLTVTDTVPAGMTPGTATSSADWACVTAGQTVTCTYTPGIGDRSGNCLAEYHDSGDALVESERLRDELCAHLVGPMGCQR